MKTRHHVRRHRTYHFLLALLLGCGLLSVLASAGYAQVQMLILLLMTFAYVVMGIGHHVVDHDVSAKVVIEYVLMGMLGMVLIVFFFR